MLNKLPLIVFLFVCCSVVSGQEVPPKSNTIIITLSDTAQLSLKIAKVLKEKDYTVKPQIKGSVVTTEPRIVKNSRFTLEARPQGKDIALSGRVVLAAQGGMPIEYKGNKGTPIMTAWEEMEKVAKAFKGKISYAVVK